MANINQAIIKFLADWLNTENVLAAAAVLVKLALDRTVLEVSQRQAVKDAALAFIAQMQAFVESVDAQAR